MHASIHLESPNMVYTNLDFIKGKLVMILNSPTSISSILIKLEGEMKTRLVAARRPDLGERPTPHEEIHKVLYKVQDVLSPNPNQIDPLGLATYVMQPGHYEYPFAFKIPFNNYCYDAPQSNTVNFAGWKIDVPKLNTQHIKATLPPTVTNFPGIAEIRYYLKATIVRKGLLSENTRVIQGFNFIPIEPPMPPASTSESYARRQHHFMPNPSPSTGDSKMKNLFTGKKSSSSADSATPPLISVDARLPNPAIIRINHDLPLRLLLKRLNESTDNLYLQSLHIEIIGHTFIRSREVYRNEVNTVVLLSRSNMNMLLDTGNQNATSQAKSPMENPDIIIDPGLWKGHMLPTTVPPTFEACCMSRRYELRVLVGIGYGTSPTRNMVVIPLVMPLSIFSGIPPPAALLKAMTATEKPTNGPVTKKPLSQAAKSNLAAAQASSSSSSSSAPAQPPRPAVAPRPVAEEEPPPSYEDAMASDLAPVDGPRNYQPPQVTQVNGGFPEEKGRRSS